MQPGLRFAFPFQVGFGHCDPAGIVYFPRFFDLFHQAMEAWFGHLGFPYADLIMGRKLGFPAVHSEADFRRPCAFGERLEVRLSVTRIGRTSLELGYRVVDPAAPGDSDAHLRLTGATVCVVMNLDPDHPGFQRSMPLPDDVRAAVEHFSGLGTPGDG